MARKIIILEQDSSNPPNTTSHVVFWLNVPAARQFYFADSKKTSVVRDATVPELNAIQNGSVYEYLALILYPPDLSIPDMQTDLLQKYNGVQADFNNQTVEFAALGLTLYGSSWDGTTWTMKTN